MPLEQDGEMDVLLVEDNPGDARLFEHHLETGMTETVPAVSVTMVETLEAALEELAETEFDLVLLDLGLPQSSGLDTLDRYIETVESQTDLKRVPVVVLTGLEDEETAVGAIERGAQDYLLKDNVNRLSLLRTLRYAVERHRQKSQLRRQNERLKRFTGVVSHDLSNPLHVASGEIELAQGDCDSDHLDHAAEALDRMDTLIDDLLTIARGGERVQDTDEVRLEDIIDDCWQTVAPTEATLVVESDRCIRADAGRLRQVLENLIGNAVTHGGESVTVRVGDLEDGFYVADDGPGIPPEKRDKVFEVGYSTAEKGTGFGLNIVQEIIKAHGWEVRVTDSEGGGARFEITGVAMVE